MLRKISKAITPKICQHGTYNQEIVCYGLEVLMATVFITTIMLTLAGVMGYGIEMIIFITTFGTLRLSAGGFHAKTHLSCFTMYFLISSAVIQIAKNVPPALYIQYMVLLLMVSMILIYRYAPAQTTNRPIYPKERIRFRRRSFFTFFFLCAVLILLTKLTFVSVASVMTMAIFMESLSLIQIKKQL